jgi:hypothetical protein
MDIQITVGDVDLSTVIGEHRVYHAEYDETESQPLTIADAIVTELTGRIVKTDAYPSLQRQVAAARIEIIHAAIEPMVQAAILSGVQATNNYGDPVGKPTTLKALIIDEVKAYLTKTTGDTYRNTSSTVIKDFVKSEVEKAIKAELSGVIAQEKEKVVAAVRAQAATIIADAVKQGLR